MSQLLARLARTLTHHWMRGLVGALVVLIVADRRPRRQPAARPSTTSRRPAPRPRRRSTSCTAHTPALAGADSTLVFSVEDGKITDPAPAGRGRGRAGEGQEAQRRRRRSRDPFAEGGAHLAGRQARVGRRPLHARPERDQEGGRRGAARRRPRRPSRTASRSPRAAC